MTAQTIKSVSTDKNPERSIPVGAHTCMDSARYYFNRHAVPILVGAAYSLDIIQHGVLPMLNHCYQLSSPGTTSSASLGFCHQKKRLRPVVLDRRLTSSCSCVTPSSFH